MQVCSSTISNRLLSLLLHNAWLPVVALPLLFALTGCGGNPNATMTQAQDPTSSTGSTPADPPAQPTSTPSSSPSSGTQSGSSSSGSSGGSSGTSGGSTNQSSLPPGVPAGAQVMSAVQTLPNWLWCTAKLDGKVCAAGLGNATSTMTQSQQTPSLSGDSSLYTIGGKTAYSNALWWHSFGPNSTPTHLVYDLYFYMQDPNLPEALEFDVNQSFNGTRYIWGSECSYRNTGHWDIWNDESGTWETTNVPCPVVSANQWHHLTWQIERVNNQVHYISVTVDGNVGTVDKYYNPQADYGGTDLNVAFQMDGDYRQDPYSVWLDNVSLSVW